MKKRDLDWTTQAQFVTMILGSSRKLGIIVQPIIGQGWSVSAFEVGLGAHGVEEVLADHSHRVVGNCASPKEAFVLAESFVKQWKRGQKSARMVACECPEMRTRMDDLVDDQINGMGGRA